MTVPVLLGTSISRRAGETARRESSAQASLKALIDMRSADAVNLLFSDEPSISGAVPSLPRLTRDAPGVTGLPGPRKPIVSEMLDILAADTAFWVRARRMFRPYILGEELWDNVYASIGLCQGGVLLNRQRLILHERHASANTEHPYSHYVHLLAARDRAYFTRWCTYVAHVEPLAARDGSEDADLALQRAVFVPPSAVEKGFDLARAVWWRTKRLAGA